MSDSWRTKNNAYHLKIDLRNTYTLLKSHQVSLKTNQFTLRTRHPLIRLYLLHSANGWLARACPRGWKDARVRLKRVKLGQTSFVCHSTVGALSNHWWCPVICELKQNKHSFRKSVLQEMKSVCFLHYATRKYPPYDDYDQEGHLVKTDMGDINAQTVKWWAQRLFESWF